MIDQRRYGLWIGGVSTGLLLAGGLLPLTGVLTPASGAGISAVWGGVFLLALPFTVATTRSARGDWLSNALTAVRGGGAVLLLAAVGLGLIGGAVGTGGSMSTGGVGGASNLPRQTVWVLFSVLALVETTDFFDGRAARRAALRAARRETSRPSNRAGRPAADGDANSDARNEVHSDAPRPVPVPFGAIWDMENDALFTFALSYVTWIVLGFPAYILLIGWMRYLYFLLARFQGDPPDYPDRYKLFAKTVAASIVVVLIGAFVPILPRSLRIGAVTIVLAMQIVSFSWDFLLHLRARHARDGQNRTGRQDTRRRGGGRFPA